MQLNQFLIDFWKKEDTVQVNANDLQALIIERDNLKREVQLLKTQCRNLHQSLALTKISLEAERTNNPITIDIKG